MSEPKTSYTELWPVTATDEGLWLLSGVEPWIPGLPVAADDTVHADVELCLHSNGVDRSDVVLIHGTSWRDDGPNVILTFIAVVRPPVDLRLNWRAAKPISPKLLGAVGKPAPHDADAAPEDIRGTDILLHALRHLAFLRDYDDTASAALDAHWLRHLANLKPALAGMYSTDHVSDRQRAA